MKIEVKEELSDGVVLRIQGDLVGGPHAEEFYRIIRQLIEREKTLVLIDLAQAKHANSSGLGILIRGYVTLKRAGGSMRLFNLSKNVDHMFKVTRFNAIIDMFESEAAARAGLS